MKRSVQPVVDLRALTLRELAAHYRETLDEAVLDEVRARGTAPDAPRVPASTTEPTP